MNLHVSETEKMLNSWRSDHDIVPDLINNIHQLKILILRKATTYDLVGDIEIDNGYSFSYQITVKFPPYFQRAVIKSQFSIYDLFAAEKDKNQIQKHTLNNMTRIDTNIFRDISTTKNQVPDDESLSRELRNDDIKVIRLKSASYWVDYISLMPNTPDWLKKQQSLLVTNNPIDTLLRSSLDFLDVNDIASVNRINEDNAILHQQTLKRLAQSNPHELINIKV